MEDAFSILNVSHTDLRGTTNQAVFLQLEPNISCQVLRKLGYVDDVNLQ
jgi:hypothetical protein